MISKTIKCFGHLLFSRHESDHSKGLQLLCMESARYMRASSGNRGVGLVLWSRGYCGPASRCPYACIEDQEELNEMLEVTLW